MTVTAAEYTNIGETEIKATIAGIEYQTIIDGNPLWQQIIDEAFPVTAFLSVAGRLDEAKLISKEKLKAAADQVKFAPILSDGAFNYEVTLERIAAIAANVADGVTNLDLEDTTNTIRSMLNADQKVLIANYKALLTQGQLDRVTEQTAVNGAISVAAIDAILAGSAFGDLSPVYE